MNKKDQWFPSDQGKGLDRERGDYKEIKGNFLG